MFARRSTPVIPQQVGQMMGATLTPRQQRERSKALARLLLEAYVKVTGMKGELTITITGTANSAPRELLASDLPSEEEYCELLRRVMDPLQRLGEFADEMAQEQEDGSFDVTVKKLPEPANGAVPHMNGLAKAE